MMPKITPDLLVDDIMRQWPETIAVFLKFRFMCVGCPISCFHTVRDACHEHHTDMATFIEALTAYVAQPALA